MIDPKKTFQETAKREGWKWQDMVDSTAFQTGATAALAEMQTNAPMAPDVATASALHWRMVGARDFLQTFMALDDKPTLKPTLPTRQLDHRV